MPSNIFEKILKIISIVVSLLQLAVKSFTGLDDDDDDLEKDNKERES